MPPHSRWKTCTKFGATQPLQEGDWDGGGGVVVGEDETRDLGNDPFGGSSEKP